VPPRSADLEVPTSNLQRCRLRSRHLEDFGSMGGMEGLTSKPTTSVRTTSN
jgi:hypothetical protein